jgi:hypothetical protein
MSEDEGQLDGEAQEAALAGTGGGMLLEDHIGLRQA